MKRLHYHQQFNCFIQVVIVVIIVICTHQRLLLLFDGGSYIPHNNDNLLITNIQILHSHKTSFCIVKLTLFYKPHVISMYKRKFMIILCVPQTNNTTVTLRKDSQTSLNGLKPSYPSRINNALLKNLHRLMALF